MKSKPTWAPSSRDVAARRVDLGRDERGLDRDLDVVGHRRARDDLGQAARRELAPRRRSSTRAKPGCLSIDGDGADPDGDVRRRDAAAAGALPRDDDLREAARDAVLGRVLRERRAARPSSRPGRCRSASSRKPGRRLPTPESCIPPRGSPTFSPTTSTPLPVTTQLDAGVGAHRPVRLRRGSGESDGSGARAVEAPDLVDRRSSRTRAARSGSCRCRAAGRGRASARRRWPGRPSRRACGEIWCSRSEKMLRPRAA